MTRSTLPAPRLAFSYRLGSLVPPEVAHGVALHALRLFGQVGSAKPAIDTNGSVISLMGLSFPNRVGLAAGFDKNGIAVEGLHALGFGFLEIGTVTPRAQPGQSRPRVFRLARDRALINRLGFPNEGAEVIARRLARRRARGIVGINIGKNATTPLDLAQEDYLAAFRAVYAVADYIVVNVSSPNTDQLRSLQEPARLEPLLQALQGAREVLVLATHRYVPLLVKLSPDLTSSDLAGTTELLLRLKLDGVIATNTTITRLVLRDSARARESGGLSGSPLQVLSIWMIRRLREALGPDFPIIGVGGIDSPEAAQAMLDAGANLIQLYTALVYHGPSLVRRIVTSLSPARAMPKDPSR